MRAPSIPSVPVGMVLYYCCPSLEAVKQLLAMVVQHACPCQDVVDSAWRQWVQLVFQAPSRPEASVVRPGQKPPAFRSHSALHLVSGAGSFDASYGNSPTGSTSSSVVTTDTVVSVHPSW